jgi:hypothetical protein
VAWDYFVRSGITVTGIRGDWTFGDNLDVVNRLTTANQMSLADAAKWTWAYARAKSKGFASVVVINAVGNAGTYRAVDVLFLP